MLKYSNNHAISKYVPYVSFQPDTRDFLNEQFIKKQKIEPFFKVRNIVDYKAIERDCLFSEIDYKIKGTKFPVGNQEKGFFDILYTEYFKYIKKTEEFGKIECPTMYAITFDKDLTPQQCPQTNIHYGEIKLYKKPVFYYIYIDLQEMIDFLKKNL